MDVDERLDEIFDVLDTLPPENRERLTRQALENVQKSLALEYLLLYISDDAKTKE